MCNCLDNIYEELKGKVDTFAKPNKPVSTFNISTTLSGRAIVPLKVYLEGQQKPIESCLIASHCPWCGEAYNGHTHTE